MAAPSQWLFSIEALLHTPSTCSIQRELYDRARGIEFLFRLGSSLQLPTPAMFTAATWFHRFYMRLSMDDFHRQDVAASCIFLATKTEECGRKLRDVAKIAYAKAKGVEVKDLPQDSREVDVCQASILLTEEFLLEALCFDFVVESPHAKIIDLFMAHPLDDQTQEAAWSIAHDSYRSPLCVLYPPEIIATACYILAQMLAAGPNSLSLDARISVAAPSASLPTPPTHKPASPDAYRQAIQHYAFDEHALRDLADALGILLEFYRVQDQTHHPYIAGLCEVPPPTSSSSRPQLFSSFNEMSLPTTNSQPHPEPRLEEAGRTPSSSHGGRSPIPKDSNTEHRRLDLS